MNKAEEKQKLREEIWNRLEEKNIARFPGAHGRIPNFEGAGKAAEKLRELKEWKKAEIIFANPDSPQQPVRKVALEARKKVVMASPKLKSGYLLLDPSEIDDPEKARTIGGAFEHGEKLKKLPKADLVVTGSVAVDLEGHRLGKGLGLGDREIARLKEENHINEKTSIVTTVHEEQLVETVPSEEHDQEVNIILSPERTIRCGVL